MINIGIEPKARLAIAKELSKLLADSYTLYLTTHKYHWNVTGPMFQTLHTLFEEQYTELAIAVDDIAERIRTLGEKAPGSYAEFQKLASVEEDVDQRSATEMIERLITAHETTIRTARALLHLAAEHGDDGTVDIATQRLQVHEKTAWMLRSFQEDV